jgi:MFS transporter, PHS family, inorganic phosphate transporter
LSNIYLSASSAASAAMAAKGAGHLTSGGNSAYHNFHNDFADVEDPNERRRLALAEIDKAPFGWYHVRACVVAGVGFFTDSYDIFAVSLLTIMIGIVYGHKGKGAISTPQDTAIKVATSAGTVIGQVGFGALADIVGRKRMYGLELILIIFATLAQSLSGAGPGGSIVGILIFWRVLMGIGEFAAAGTHQLHRLIFTQKALAAIILCHPLSPLSKQGPLNAFHVM